MDLHRQNPVFRDLARPFLYPYRIMKCFVLLIACCLCFSVTKTLPENLHRLDHPSSSSYSYESEKFSTPLNVHIVPHTHDDSGWLKTFEQYYWGSRQDVQAAGVRYILDSVTAALVANPERRFTFAEMSFFSRWWSHQDDHTRQIVRQLVEDGRLNFVNGGYVQHDEAGAHFVAMIDQTTRGHRFLLREFNVTPRVGWQIDPFGHSSTQAGLLGASVGFDAVFFGRADYQDMALRRKEKELEMIWYGSGDANEGDIFTGNFASGNYGPPIGFWWEWSNSPDPPMIEDGPDKNIRERVDAFVQRCHEIANMTRGNDIMLTMGSDFHYAAAHVWFTNLDSLIQHVNLDGRVHAFYSSPEDYVAAKHQYSVAWPDKEDDFFPYSDTPHAFWTGYFTSRSTSKAMIRSSTAYLQAARQLEAFLNRSCGGHGRFAEDVSTDALEEAVSLTQHHDAITGTAKQHVANDYHARLHRGLIVAQELVHRSLKCLLTSGKFASGRSISIASSNFKRNFHDDQIEDRAEEVDPTMDTWFQTSNSAMGPSIMLPQIPQRSLSGSSDEDHRVSLREESLLDEWALETCMLLNVSSCKTSVILSQNEAAGGGFLLIAYNPLAWKRVASLRVPVSTKATCSFEVTGPDGEDTYFDLVPVSLSTIHLQSLLVDANATEKDHAGDAEIVFMAELPPLGYSAFEIRPIYGTKRHEMDCFTYGENDSDENFAHWKPSTIMKAGRFGDGRRGMNTDHTLVQKEDIDHSRINEPNERDVHVDNRKISFASSKENDKFVYVLSNGLVNLHFDKDTGRLTSMVDKEDGISTPLDVSFISYNSSDGFETDEDRGQASGAYIFRPNGEDLIQPKEKHLNLQIHNGHEVSEAKLTFTEWVHLIIRLHRDQKHVEFEWTVGPVPFKDGFGREIAVRYSSGLCSEDVFWTDANGRKMMPRRRNYRPTWNLNVTEPIAGNFYPVTAAAFIQDQQRGSRLTVLVDRAQAATSQNPGELEFMIHRRILHDDRRGVGEALNETLCGCTDCDCPGLVVRGSHWLSLSDHSRRHTTRVLQQLRNDPPLLVFAPLQNDQKLFESRHLVKSFSLTGEYEMPRSTQLITLLRPMDSPHVLLVRLAHLQEQEEIEQDDMLEYGRSHQEVDLLKIIRRFGCSRSSRVKELSLSTNQQRKGMEEHRKRFKSLRDVENRIFKSYSKKHGDNDDPWKVRLHPMEIRTFEIEC